MPLPAITSAHGEARPARITDTGALRSHFTHVIDVGPTILDIAGIPAPSHVDGIEQEPSTV